MESNEIETADPRLARASSLHPLLKHANPVKRAWPNVSNRIRRQQAAVAVGVDAGEHGRHSSRVADLMTKAVCAEAMSVGLGHDAADPHSQRNCRQSARR